MEPDQGQIDLRHYLGTLLRRKWILIASVGSVLFFTLLLVLFMPKTFEASTTILVEQGGEGLSFFSPTGYLRRQNAINNQVEIVESRSLAKRVIAKLRGEGGLSILRDPEPVEAFLEAVSAKPVKDTDLISISALAPTSQEAALLANTVADCFLEQSLLATRGELTEVRNFLEGQLPIVENRLKESEEALSKFKQENALVSLSEETRGLTSKLSYFDRLHSEASTELATVEKRLSHIRDQLSREKKGLVEEVSRVTSPFVLSLRDELIQLETDYSLYQLQGLGSDHPKMVDLGQRIENTRARLQEETEKLLSQTIGPANPLSIAQELTSGILALEVDVDVLRARKSAIAKVTRAYAEELNSLPGKEMKLARLQRDYEINENIFKMLRQKYEEVRIEEAGRIAGARVIDTADPPKFPVRPKRRRSMLFGLLFGIGLGIVGVVLAEHLDTSVKSAEEVERNLDLPVLGSIPMVTGDGVSKSRVSSLITHSSPHSPIAEAYRAIRTNLRFTKLDAPLKTILVTSAVPQEGKSTVAANMAIATAQSGVKTLLLESDLRRPLVHLIFSVDQEPGLTDLILERASVESVARATEIENLHLIPSGSLPPNPAEILGSQGMRSLVKGLRQKFDLVIFDSPPLIAFTDAAVLGAELDGVALVVHLGRTHREVVTRAKQQLNNVKADLLGVILNKVPLRGYDGYSSPYYYHYYYSKYYQRPGEEAGSETRGRIRSLRRKKG